MAGHNSYVAPGAGAPRSSPSVLKSSSISGQWIPLPLPAISQELRRGGLSEARIPGERHRERAPIHQFHRQAVLACKELPELLTVLKRDAPLLDPITLREKAAALYPDAQLDFVPLDIEPGRLVRFATVPGMTGMGDMRNPPSRGQPNGGARRRRAGSSPGLAFTKAHAPAEKGWNVRLGRGAVRYRVDGLLTGHAP